MKHVLATVALLFNLLSAMAQPMGEMDTYLDNPKIYAAAKQYYNDEIRSTANEFTKRIVDSMDTKNNAVRPFYLLQVSKMLMYTDAELAQILFRECYGFLEKKPNELMEFLYCDSKYVLSDYKTYWSTAMAFQLRKVAKGDPKTFLAELHEKLEKKCKKKMQPHLTAFLDLVAARL